MPCRRDRITPLDTESPGPQPAGMAGYNYDVFNLAKAEEDFVTFRDGLHVTDRAPDFPLENALTGERVQMKSLWQTAPAIIEFGSFT